MQCNVMQCNVSLYGIYRASCRRGRRSARRVIAGGARRVVSLQRSARRALSPSSSVTDCASGVRVSSCLPRRARGERRGARRAVLLPQRRRRRFRELPLLPRGNGMERNGMEWDGLERNRTEQNRTETAGAPEQRCGWMG